MVDFDRTVDWKAVMNDIASGYQIDFNMVDEPVSKPTCPDCDGTGYVRYDVGTDDSRFGKMFRCPNPDCPVVNAQRVEQSEKVASKSTWEEDYGELTFENFRRLCEKLQAWDGKRGAYAAAKMFAINNGQPFSLQDAAQQVLTTQWPGADTRKSNCLVLAGDVGLGKTGLGVGAANELRAQAKPVVFIRLMDLLKEIQDTYDKSSFTTAPGDSTSDLYRFYNTIPFLILDEFGIKNYKPDRLEIVETIIRARDRAKLPTFITTNLTLEQVSDGEGWDKQIGDIVKKSHWVEMGGVKLRQTAKKVAAW